MSLRARLTLLYVTLLGGILLTFGLAVYGVVSVNLLNAIDDRLIQTFNTILRDINEIAQDEALQDLEDITLPSLDLTGDVIVQAWSRDNRLIASNISPQFRRPLDPPGLQSPVPVFRDAFFSDIHLRVLTIPLELGGRPIGTLQLATSLEVVDATQTTLVTVLLFGSAIAMALAGIAGWLSTRRALAP